MPMFNLPAGYPCIELPHLPHSCHSFSVPSPYNSSKKKKRYILVAITTNELAVFISGDSVDDDEVSIGALESCFLVKGSNDGLRDHLVIECIDHGYTIHVFYRVRKTHPFMHMGVVHNNSTTVIDPTSGSMEVVLFTRGAQVSCGKLGIGSYCYKKAALAYFGALDRVLGNTNDLMRCFIPISA